MDFAFSEQQEHLRQTARAFLGERGGLARARAVLESRLPWDEELWKAAAELGWLGAAVPSDYGGAGFSVLELAVIAEELGRALAPIPFSSSICLATQAVLDFSDEAMKARELPRLARGALVGSFAIAERPGKITPRSIEARLTRRRLRGRKLAVADGAIANRAVVAVREDGQLGLAWVDLTQPQVERIPVHSVDPTHPCATLGFHGARAERLDAHSPVGWPGLEALLQRAAVLLAFEQLGGAERAFELTKQYAERRYAFGRPVASFQALKHRLVGLYVALEIARSNCLYAAWATSTSAPELPRAAAAARVSATEAFELAAREMIQMHGGIGFTWEHDAHLFYRRAKHTALSLGSVREWRERLVQALESQCARRKTA